jgi:hypothetical protein
MVDEFQFGQEQKPAAAKGGFTLFKKKEPEKVAELAAPSMGEALNSVDARLKMLEERHNDLTRKVQLIDKNLLDERTRFSKEIKEINSDILELKRELHDLNTKAELIISELRICARKDELDALSKYIDLWEPLNFITRNEVNKIIKEEIENAKNKAGEKED